ncbi:MAG TPA: tetratricopeptide repeat protein [Pyrinomonadaceae bacterium]|nr:tetratricopeptide repeat protein [Pyrinomonadaceae bacterium]
MGKALTACLAAALALLAAACGQSEAPKAGAAANGGAQTSASANRPKGSSGDVGVVSSHGGASQSPQGGGDGAADRALVDTKELDARIKKAADKAKASGASAADKKEAADAYLARGNVYYEAGQPRLYKYALADFRQVLRFDPSNKEAEEKIDMIESIYKGMGRPVPEVSAEQ